MDNTKLIERLELAYGCLIGSHIANSTARNQFKEIIDDLKVVKKLTIPVVIRSKPINEETDTIDHEECVWENPAHEQTLVDIDKSLDLEQTIEDKTIS